MYSKLIYTSNGLLLSITESFALSYASGQQSVISSKLEAIVLY